MDTMTTPKIQTLSTGTIKTLVTQLGYEIELFTANPGARRFHTVDVTGPSGTIIYAQPFVDPEEARRIANALWHTYNVMHDELEAATLAGTFVEDEGPTCSICDGLGHGYPGGPACPLERGTDDGFDAWERARGVTA